MWVRGQERWLNVIFIQVQILLTGFESPFELEFQATIGKIGSAQGFGSRKRTLESHGKQRLDCKITLGATRRRCRLVWELCEKLLICELLVSCDQRKHKIDAVPRRMKFFQAPESN